MDGPQATWPHGAQPQRVRSAVRVSLPRGNRGSDSVSLRSRFTDGEPEALRRRGRASGVAARQHPPGPGGPLTSLVVTCKEGRILSRRSGAHKSPATQPGCTRNLTRGGSAPTATTFRRTERRLWTDEGPCSHFLPCSLTAARTFPPRAGTVAPRNTRREWKAEPHDQRRSDWFPRDTRGRPVCLAGAGSHELAHQPAKDGGD